MGAHPIALLTDFGDLDAYVGVMKGVILGLAPQVPLVDITHRVPPGDVRRAALLLWQAAPYFPPGTIFLTVVDPGVGTARRGLAVRFDGLTCVGPDNGLFTYLLTTRAGWQAVELRDDALGLPAPSRTFHGRDLFAPAAARLACGQALESCGPTAHDLIRFPLPRCQAESDSTLIGEVIAGDAFGNAITSLGALREAGPDLALDPWLPGCPPMRLASAGLEVALPDERRLRLAPTFAAAAPGQPLAYIGSSGLLEIGVNQGHAIDQLGLALGQPIRLTSGRRRPS